MEDSGRKQQAANADLPVCSPCENGGSEIEAHGFCSNCNEHLCEACYTSHLRHKQFRKHVLLDKSLMPQEAPSSDDMCPEHPAQQLEYYCKNHDKLACSRCETICHRTCEDVRHIEDICDDIEETEEFKTMYKTLTSIGHSATQNEAKVSTNLIDIQTNVDEAKTSIRSFRKHLDEQLDKMEEAPYKEVGEISIIGKTMLENVSAECITLTSEVRTVIHNIDVSRKSQQNMRMFIQMKNTQRWLAEWRKQMDDISSINITQQYKFEPAKRLQGITREVQALGYLVMKDDMAKQSDLGKTGKVIYSRVMGQQNTPLDMTVVKDDVINVVQVFGNNSYITGSVRIDSNILAIADFNNKSVKTVDLNRKKVKHCLALKDDPYDITRISVGTLAVTCPYGKYIQVMKVHSGSLELQRQIYVNGQCHGIRYTDTGGGILVVSFVHPHKVKVMNMYGTVLDDLSLDTAGRPRFACPFHIAISNDGNTLIVSNTGGDTVTGLGLDDGVVKFEYWDDELRNPLGVAVGDRGEIYVCSKFSNSIHVISNEGRKVLLEDDDRLNGPGSITYSQNKLFIGSENINNIGVYRIQYQ